MIPRFFEEAPADAAKGANADDSSTHPEIEHNKSANAVSDFQNCKGVLESRSILGFHRVEAQLPGPRGFCSELKQSARTSFRLAEVEVS